MAKIYWLPSIFTEDIDTGPTVYKNDTYFENSFSNLHSSYFQELFFKSPYLQKIQVDVRTSDVMAGAWGAAGPEQDD
jgi:hypothetical protein